MVTLLLCLHTLPFVIWLFLYHIHFQFPQNSFWLYRFFILIYSYVCETLDVSLHLRISCVFPLFFVMYNESYVENVYTIRYKCFDRSIARLNIIFLRFCLLCITRSYRIMSVPECIRNVCTCCIHMYEVSWASVFFISSIFCCGGFSSGFTTTYNSGFGRFFEATPCLTHDAIVNLQLDMPSLPI